jgi:hypothetical protein
MGSYGVGSRHAWCSRKACEIYSSLVQKKNLKRNYFSSHKLPKQQSTNFCSQGILGVKGCNLFRFNLHNVTLYTTNYKGFKCDSINVMICVKFYKCTRWFVWNFISVYKLGAHVCMEFLDKYYVNIYFNSIIIHHSEETYTKYILNSKFYYCQ